jgi:chaperonin cofactor prefoldin
MLGFNQGTDDKEYKSLSRKLITFSKKSRDNWKTKYQDLKYKMKLMQNKIVYLEKRKAHFNQRIKELQHEFGIWYRK